jgi:hypothetical protein
MREPRAHSRRPPFQILGVRPGFKTQELDEMVMLVVSAPMNFGCRVDHLGNVVSVRLSAFEIP